MSAGQVRFFRSATEFYSWLERYHLTRAELWVGFYKKGAGRVGLTYHEGVDTALCFGWIDGHKKRVDDLSYTHRFTPRRPGSIWSAINVRRAQALRRAGLMHSSGVAAFNARTAKRTGVYTYENAVARLSIEMRRRWKARPVSWRFFNAQPAGYQKLVKGWIMRAKHEETRMRRLESVIVASAAGKRVR